MRQPVMEWLGDCGFVAAAEFQIFHMVDLVGAKWGPRPSKRGRPPLIDCLSVELKLERLSDAIYQATSNAYRMRSYVAMPAERCERMRPATIERFRLAGIGLLAIDEIVTVVVEARHVETLDDRLVTKLWRRTKTLYPG